MASSQLEAGNLLAIKMGLTQNKKSMKIQNGE